MRRWMIVAALLLCLPMVGEGQSIRYHPDLSTLTLGKPTSASIRFHPAIASGSTLLTGLVSYWPLDEESGTRYDSVGSNDLTDNNTVGFDTGVNGAAASFVAANGESLSRASFDPGAVWTASYWVRLDAVSGQDISFEIQNIVYDFTGIGQIYFFGTGGAGAYSYAPPAAGEWHHVFLWTDGTKVYAQRDGGTVWEDTRVSASGANTLSIGRALPSYYITGRVDEVAIWDRVLTSDERAELYNAGAGKFYPF